MADEQSFLKAICSSPDDNSLRLIFSDWLEERGDLRAEFIRVELELANLEPRGSRWRELTARQLDLIRAHKGEWTDHLKGMVTSCRFDRGFVASVSMTPKQFVTHAKELFQRAPVTKVALTAMHDPDSHAQAVALAQCPELARVRNLSTNRNVLRDPALEALLRSRHLTNLQGLDVGVCSLTTVGIRALAECQHLRSLEELSIELNSLTDSDVGVLAASSHLSVLQVLNVSANDIGDDAIRSIVRGFDSLKSLNCGHYYEGNITDAGMQELAGSRLMGSLISLQCHAQLISDRGLLSLLRNIPANQLRQLDLSRTFITDMGIVELAASPNVAELRQLNLEGNTIGEQGGNALAASPHLAKLASLNLKGATLSKELKKTLRERFGIGVCTFSR